MSKPRKQQPWFLPPDFNPSHKTQRRITTMANMTTKMAPSYTIEGDTVTFADGLKYTMKPKRPGDTRATPEEMWAILSGASAIPGTPEEIAEDARRRQQKVDLTFDPEAEARERSMAQRVNPNNPIT
jgi:hypothetical protein